MRDCPLRAITIVEPLDLKRRTRYVMRDLNGLRSSRVFGTRRERSILRSIINSYCQEDVVPSD